MSLNKVLLIGNLGKDPEVRYLDNNKVVATFTIATNETYTDRNGEKKTETEWHNVEMWDQLARTAEKFLKKGSQVYVEGKIKTENWRDKDGNERTGKKVRATAMTLLGPRTPNENNMQQQPVSNTQPPHSNEPSGFNDEGASDDLPF